MTKWVAVIWIAGAIYIVGNQLVKPRQAVIFCNVGQGDMMLIIDGSWQMAVDSGPATGVGRECWDRYVPWWDRTIEAVMVTHDDADHSGGVGALSAGLKVEKIITDGSYKIDGVEPEEWVTMNTGDKIKHDNLELEILDNPKNRESLKDTGLVSVLKYDTRIYWLMGDADLETEQMLTWTRPQLSSYGGQAILKVSHHGSAKGTSEELIKAIKPVEAVISVGKNKYGHPSSEAIGRLEKAGVKVRRTDREEDVRY
jgi:competence protein ComEC